MKKNGFFTFVCALVPGCGQMYQGYMKRGASLLFWFIAIIFLSTVLRFGSLALLLLVVWAYAFFDAFNLHALTPDQRAVFRDDYIPGASWLKERNMGSFIGRVGTGKVIGWALIGVGVLALWNTFFSGLYSIIWHYFPEIAPLLDTLPSVVVAVVVIILGIRMLRGKKQPPVAEDDIVPFEGDQNEQTQQ